MDGPTTKVDQAWAAEQWASIDPKDGQGTVVRWTSDEWVGDQHAGEPPHRVAGPELIDGQHGLSGYGHTEPAAHWAPVH
jgi:hypothetical protein